MSVKIMIDSASDINEGEARSLGIFLVPMQVTLGGQEYYDGVTLLSDEFFNKLKESGDMPQTSLINAFRWGEAFEKATKDSDELVVVTLSSQLSGTYAAAMQAAEKSQGKVWVVDSLNAALGERLLGLYALRLAKENLSAKEIAERLEKQKSKIRLYAVIDTLEYLKKGGRISATTAFFGELLGIKPIVSVIDGKVEMIGKAKGHKKSFQFIHECVKKTGGICFDMPYGVIYSGTDRTNVEKYKEESAEILQGHDVQEYSLGCTIGTHIGPGAVGIAYFVE